MSPEYKKYLDSPEWKKLSMAILNRDKWKCVKCGVRRRYKGVETYLQVHHLTYENIFHEKLEDLTTLCKSCHDASHNKTFEVFNLKGTN